jgi:hypothetical protein
MATQRAGNARHLLGEFGVGNRCARVVQSDRTGRQERLRLEVDVQEEGGPRSIHHCWSLTRIPQL